jgi:hypothetical protein
LTATATVGQSRTNKLNRTRDHSLHSHSHSLYQASPRPLACAVDTLPSFSTQARTTRNISGLPRTLQVHVHRGTQDPSAGLNTSNARPPNEKNQLRSTTVSTPQAGHRAVEFNGWNPDQDGRLQ